jgi:hypothetical protein
LRLGRLLLLAGCFGLIAGGCETDLELRLEGLRCNGDNRCSDGYACDRDTRLCVKNSADAGLGGSPAGAGGTPPGGAGSGHSGSGGNAGVGGGSPLGGQGGLDGGGGGAGGSDDLDAGPPALVDGGPDGCVPTTLFRDRDADTYGDVATTGIGCPQLGWVTRAGDCRDDIALVNVGQEGFFGEGFVDQNKPGGISFDYNCSNAEDPSPNNDLDPVPPCMGVGLLCNGTNGMLPANDPPRQGPGVDARCGSSVRRDCEFSNILSTCTPADTTLGDDFTFVCR